MVTEQLGPQSKDARLRGSLDDRDAVRSTHPARWILHGPVVYADELYDAPMRDADGATRIARSVFTKNATHSAQREYRFATLRDGLVDGKVRLMISGMMRDSLRPSTS